MSPPSPVPVSSSSDSAAELPAVSVIVVNHNGASYLEPCLRSLMAQRGVVLEVLVVDNASTDRSAEVVASFPDVQLIRSSQNLGYAGAINLGLRAACAPVVVVMNEDTRAESGCVERLSRALEASPEVWAVTPLILIDGRLEQVNALGAALHVTGLSFCNGLGRPRSTVPSSPFSVPGLSGACFAMRREQMLWLGGAPEHCFLGNDDVLLSWYIRLAGGDIRCVPDAVLTHRYGLRLDPAKLFYVERNRYDLLLSVLHPGTLLALAPLLLVTEGAIFAFCALRGRDQLKAKLDAMHQACLRRHETLMRRDRLRQVRRVSDLELLSAMRLLPEGGQLMRLLGRRERSGGVHGRRETQDAPRG